MKQETQLEQDLRAGKCGTWRTPLPVTGVDTIVNNQPAAPERQQLELHPWGNSPDNYDLQAVAQRCKAYNGSFRQWCDTSLNPIDHALAEIAYMNQKTETRTQVARSLWKARS